MNITPEMITEDEKRWHARDVITELGYCGHYMRDRKDMTNLDIRFYAYLMRKAHDMLKAQIPRVMTADEIKSDYVEIFYFETRAGMLRGCVKELSNLSGSSIVYLVCGLDDDIYWRALDGYGITWRAWTRRPSFEQMANTPWEGSEADGKN